MFWLPACVSWNDLLLHMDRRAGGAGGVLPCGSAGGRCHGPDPHPGSGPANSREAELPGLRHSGLTLRSPASALLGLPNFPLALAHTPPTTPGPAGLADGPRAPPQRSPVLALAPGPDTACASGRRRASPRRPQPASAGRPTS